MIKKVLIVDDIDAVNVGVKGALETLGITDIVYSTYCDNAYLKIKKATLDNTPFDLIICDLSFLEDHREREITSGQELIEMLKVTYPQLKTIAFSIEDHPHTVRMLWEDIGVDAYVCKDREGIKELINALKVVNEGGRYLPQKLEMQLAKKNIVTLTNYDEELLRLLASGKTQREIAIFFKKKEIFPASHSSVEKRLKELRESFNASTNIHLISILKDFKLL